MRKKSNVDKLLEVLLKEDTPEQYPQNMNDIMSPEMKDNSLDQVVDRYLVRFERESIPTSEVYESLDHLIGDLIYEQEDPPEDLEDEPADEEEPADDEGFDDLGGDLGDDLGGDEEGGEEASPPVMTTPRIDIDSFARAVARLVNNFEALLNPKTIILNRAESYIMNNYDPKTAQEMMQLLDVNYDLKPVESSEELENGEYPQTYTAGATPGGGGG